MTESTSDLALDGEHASALDSTLLDSTITPAEAAPLPSEPRSWPEPPGIPIAAGDWIILLTADGKRFTVQAGTGLKGLHVGELDLGALVGMEYGRAARTKGGQPVYLLRPSLQDHLMSLKRITQIIYPKDVGTILLKLGIGEGSTVIECGTGSGALTLAMAWIIGPTGHVYTYEKEKLHHVRARGNLERVGLGDRVTFKLRDASVEGFDERGVHAGFLDVREATDLLPQMIEALAPGGVLGLFVPTTNQVSDILRELEAGPFIDTEVMETSFRKYKVNPNRLRPEDRMIAHTGFLVFTRRIVPVDDFVPPVLQRRLPIEERAAKKERALEQKARRDAAAAGVGKPTGEASGGGDLHDKNTADLEQNGTTELNALDGDTPSSGAEE